jgi:beta-N-acetylhexosaminidase
LSLATIVDETGRDRYDRDSPAVIPSSQFDLASLTKVVATTTAVMLLEERGVLSLDATVVSYYPAFRHDEVTVRHLLTHTSGLPAFREYEREGITTRQGIIDAILSEPLYSAPGEAFVYSDFGPILLAVVIAELTGTRWALWCTENIFAPLGMVNTQFRDVPPYIVRPDDEGASCSYSDGPNENTAAACVPTELDEVFRHRLVQGEVHDERAWCLGGAAGHAGLFSTIEDMAKFAAMMVGEGAVTGTGTKEQFLKPETIRRFTAVAHPPSGRALGWDTKSIDGYSSAGEAPDGFSSQSYGHTGFTGTSIWVDPHSKLWCVLLTNRVHPSRISTSSLARNVGLRGGEKSGIIAVRSLLADTARAALL